MKKRARLVIPDVIVTETVCPDTGGKLSNIRRLSDAERFAIYARSKIRKARLLDRVLEANKDHQAGEVIQGWRRDKARRWDQMSILLVPKGWIIRTHGRAFWETIPRANIIKDGKRAFVRQLDLVFPQPRQYGTPISELSGRPGHAGHDRFCEIASSWGYD